MLAVVRGQVGAIDRGFLQFPTCRHPERMGNNYSALPTEEREKVFEARLELLTKPHKTNQKPI